jgi:predicted PurR-regulated permease PerM
MPRGGAIGLFSLGMLAITGALGLLIVPPLIDQGQRFAEKLPDYVDRAQELVNTNPTVHAWLQRHANQGAADPQTIYSGAMSLGTGLVSGIVNLVTVVALTIYLLVDGPRLYAWALGLLSPRTSAKVERARPEVSRVISGYVLGQLITSLLFGAFTFVVLAVAGVPDPLLLAVLAAFLDAIPMIGATAATIPAVLLSLTVSVPTAVIVLLLYVGYQQVENYVITPRVYGETLQISSLAALLAVLVGAALLGVLGVLLALPVAAALPVVARIWREDILDDQLGFEAPTQRSDGT